MLATPQPRGRWGAAGRGARRALAVAGVGLACAPSHFDVGALEERFAELAEIPGQRLGDAVPYLLPWRDEGLLLLCRWERAQPIDVALPPTASGAEAALLRAALRAWEGAGLGVRFREVAILAGAGIEIRFVGEPGEYAPRAADAVTECEVDPAALTARPGPRLAARLRVASLHLRRAAVDVLGRDVPLRDAELAGAALHELGHALGFQGHARRGRGVMVREVEAVRRVGRRLLRGERFADPTLAALYRVPSGSVVGRVALLAGRSDPVERMAALAVELGLSGPSLRVGDRAARIAWRDAAGRTYALLVPELPAALRQPARLRVLPMARTRDLWGQSPNEPSSRGGPDPAPLP